MDLDKPLLQSRRTREDEDKGGNWGGEPAPKLQRSYFDVLGICCSSEIPLVESILKPMDGVKDVSVIVVSRTVIVVHDDLLASQADILNALNKARLEASLKGSGDDFQKKMKWPSPYVIASGVLLLLSLFKYIYDPLKWVALGAVAAGIFPILSKGIAALRGFRIDINILALCAVIGTIILKDYVESATIIFLFSIAQWLESKAGHKASSVMSSLMSMAPQKATIAENGQVVDVSEVQLNTVVAVKPGEAIPIDGAVVDGISEVDEKTLTGESFPVSKRIESLVWAGTINLNGYISLRTTALAEDCVVARMVKLVEEAQNKKSRTQRFVDEFAKYYTPTVLVISIAIAVVPWALQVSDRDQWLSLALVVLVSACPCSLILSTPVATFCALTKAAEHGLLFKGGDYLETLGKVKTVAFDKTGTITRGEFSVSEFRSLRAEITLEVLLCWVSSIESKSSHPIASPLVQYALSQGVEPRPEDVEDFQNFPGHGVYGKIDGRDVYIGNKRIALKAGSEIGPNLDINAMRGKTVGYVFVGATLVGIFSLSDECRTGVTEAIEQLKYLNVKTAILTGDSQEAANYAQNQLNNAPDLVFAELLPEEKLKIIEELKKDGLTAMVGDGINDAPSLAASNIGISMGISGSALAVETGHLIMMSNDMGNIPRAVLLGRRAQRKVIENVVVSVLSKGAVLALAFAGYPLVWVAVLADTGTCLIVILNSMLLLRENRGDGLGQEHCRRLSVLTEGKASGDENSLGRNRGKCCDVNNCGSSIIVNKAKVSVTEEGNKCCKSGKCYKLIGTQEEVICESSYCPIEVYETESVSCKSRNLCSVTRQAEKASADEILLGQDRSDCCGPMALETKSVTCKSGCCSSKQYETKAVSCKSKSFCSDKIAYENLDSTYAVSSSNASSCCGSKTTISVDTGSFSQGKCSATKYNDLKSAPGQTEPIQRDKDIESGQVQEEITQPVKNGQASGCCENSYCRGCCLTEIITA